MREKRRERPRRCVGAPLYSGICACRSSIRFFSVGQKNFLRQRRCCAILLRRFVLGRGRRYAERCPSWPKEHDWKSCMPQKGIWGSNPHLSARLIPRASSRLALIWRPFAGASPLRRGGRVVECGGLENRFTGAPGDEGSNPSSSAFFVAKLFNSLYGNILQRRGILPVFSGFFLNKCAIVRVFYDEKLARSHFFLHREGF